MANSTGRAARGCRQGQASEAEGKSVGVWRAIRGSADVLAGAETVSHGQYCPFMRPRRLHTLQYACECLKNGARVEVASPLAVWGSERWRRSIWRGREVER